MKIDVLDLFSGCGGFSKGLSQAGFDIQNHYFSEVDKYAIANYKKNFKESKYVGAVQDVRGIKADIITFGSPCQDFSLAGKRKGMDGSRSSLILEAIRIIGETRPSVFIWENVKGAFSSNGGADFWGIIAAFANIGGYRLEWQLLNTSWFLPQNRERIYLVGHLAGRSQPGVFPIGEGSKEVDVNRSRNEAEMITNASKLEFGWKNTSPCLNARDYKEPKIVKQVQPVLTPDRKEKRQNGRRFKEDGEPAHTLTSQDRHGVMITANTSKGYDIATEQDSINLSVPTSKTRRGRVGKGKAQTIDTQANQGVLVSKVQTMVNVRKYEVDVKGLQKVLKQSKAKTKLSNKAISKKTNTPKTTVDHWFRVDSSFSIPDAEIWVKLKDVLKIKTTRFDDSIMVFEQKEGNYDKSNRAYSAEGTSPTLTSSTAGEKIITDSQIRRLTEIECERLQGFPDDWTKYGEFDGVTKEISRTQRYKMLGNAVTVNVVQAIGERLIKQL